MGTEASFPNQWKDHRGPPDRIAGPAQHSRGTRTAIALPGTFCDPAIYAPLRHHVRREFNLTALSWMTDAPACGLDTLATWVADRIRRARSGPVVLIGHSSGGAIALQLALTQPHLLAGLLLINTGPNMHHHGDVGGLIETMECDGTGNAVNAVIDRSFHVAPPPEVRHRLLRYGHAVPVRAALEILRSQQAADFAPLLPSLRLPAAVVHGRFDPVRTATEARATVAAMPDGRLHVVDSGHSPMYEAPEAIAAVLGELVRRIGRSGLVPRSGD